MVTLELEKKARSSEVAYDILLNLLEHNTKQNVSQELFLEIIRYLNLKLSSKYTICEQMGYAFDIY
jgi:hypothetical protein